MRQQLLDLYEIQKIDLSIRDDQRHYDSIPKALAQQEAVLQGLERQHAQLTLERQTAEKEARSVFSLLDGEKDKIRKWEARLGELRNQREYQALHRETEGQRRANRDHEEKLQALYKQQESLDEQLLALNGKIAELSKEVQAERAEVNDKLAALGGIMQTKRDRRELLVPGVPKPLFRKYDTIRAKRLGIGLSVVTDGCCTSCNMRLPPQLYNILQRADTIEQCPSCHRVVLWEALLTEAEERRLATLGEQADPSSAHA